MSTVAATRSGSDGFFGAVITGLQEGLSRIGSDVLPNWVSSQVGLQNKDQLSDITYQSVKPVVDSSIQTTSAVPPQTTESLLKSAADFTILRFGNFNITAGGLVIAGFVFVGSLFLLKRI